MQLLKQVVGWCRLLMTLTQALQSSGVDLSQASISIQIDLGKRAKQGATPGLCGNKVL